MSATDKLDPFKIDDGLAVEVVEILGVHQRLVPANRLADLPHDAGAGGVELIRQHDRGCDHVILRLHQIIESGSGDVEADIVVGRQERAAFGLSGGGDVVGVKLQGAVGVLDADEGSGAFHVGAAWVEPPGQPPRLVAQLGAEGDVKLPARLVETPRELGFQRFLGAALDSGGVEFFLDFFGEIFGARVRGCGERGEQE